MKLLKSLYGINSKSGHEAEIKKFVLEQLADVELAVEEDSFGNIFITKGIAVSYPCVSAHLDEVHVPVEKHLIVDGDMIYANYIWVEVEAVTPNKVYYTNKYSIE